MFAAGTLRPLGAVVVIVVTARPSGCTMVATAPPTPADTAAIASAPAVRAAVRERLRGGAAGYPGVWPGW